LYLHHGQDARGDDYEAQDIRILLNFASAYAVILKQSIVIVSRGCKKSL